MCAKKQQHHKTLGVKAIQNMRELARVILGMIIFQAYLQKLPFDMFLSIFVIFEHLGRICLPSIVCV